MHPRVRLSAWIVVVVLILGGQGAWLWGLRGERILHSDPWLMGGQCAITLLLIAMAALLATTSVDAIRLPPGTSRRIIVAGTVLLQGGALLCLAPSLSEDVVRYRLDGRTWLAGLSPYRHPPASRWDQLDLIDRTVTYPDMRTIYPPVSQLAFVAGAAAERLLPASGAPAEGGNWRTLAPRLPWYQRAFAHRLLFGAAAVVSALLLMRLLARVGASLWWATLFAWNPLVTIECAGMGHQDILAVPFLLGSLLAARDGAPKAAGVWLALACGIKPFAVLLLPFLYLWRRQVVVLVSFAVLGFALLVPPLLVQDGYVGWAEQGRTYSRAWEANGSVYALIKWGFGTGDEGRNMMRAKEAARLLAFVVVLAVGWRLAARGAPAEEAGYWLFLTFFLFAPVTYAWYLIWALCWVPLLSGRAGWALLVWCGTASLSYLLWRHEGWQLPAWVLVVQYAPVYLLAAAEWHLTDARTEPRSHP